MRSIIVVLVFGVVSSLAVNCGTRTAAARQPAQRKARIIGGWETNITKYPSAAIVHDYAVNSDHFYHRCGGVIVNIRSILTAAACIREFVPVNSWRVRVGSTYASNGGVVHTASKLILHPDYNMCTRDNDIALIRSNTRFDYNDNVKRATISGKNYIVPDNQLVWAVGWGVHDQQNYPGLTSEKLREVPILSINWNTCREFYNWATGLNVSQSMLCTGLLQVSGRGQCAGDTGGPVYHNSIVVGIHVWDDVFPDCNDRYVPGVNMKVSSYIDWLEENI